MNMIDHLTQTRTPRELATELVKSTQHNCKLRDEIDKARYELFWRGVADRKMSAKLERAPNHIGDTNNMVSDALTDKTDWIDGSSA